MTRYDLLKLRKDTLRLTQVELAAELGVSVSTYNLIENGKRRGSQKFWVDLQNKYNLEDEAVWKMQKPTI